MELIDINLLVENDGQIDGLPKNPRFIEDDKFDKLVKSLKKKPHLLNHRPLMVIEHGGKYIVLGGNMRLRGCQKLGWQKVPCSILSKEESNIETLREYVLVDNISYGKDDWDLMQEEWMPLLDLEELGMDIPEEYKSLAELDDQEDDLQPLCDENEIPEIRELRSRRGDVFILGKHRLVCGDATNFDDIDKLMQGEKADMVWTDPPYNVAVSGKGKINNTGTILNDDMSSDNFNSFLIDVYASYYAFLKKGGVIYVAHSESERVAFTKNFIDAGFKYSQNLIWVKHSGVMCRQDFNWKHEPILYGWKEGAGHYFCGDFTRTSVIDDSTNDDIDYKKLNKEQLIKVIREFRNQAQRPESVIEYDRPMISDLHPTMKPVGLVELMIGWSSKENEVVLDLFGGSGSTLIAAHKLKRRARLMELDEKFSDVIISRYIQYTGQEVIRESDGKKWQDIEVYKQ